MTILEIVDLSTYLRATRTYLLITGTREEREVIGVYKKIMNAVGVYQL